MQKKRVILVYAVVFVAFFCLLLRLFYLQIFDGSILSKAASTQRMASSEVLKDRGEILDRSGIPFTDRDKKVTLVLKPDMLRGKEAEIDEISSLLDVNSLKLKQEITFKREPILIETDETKKNSIFNLNIQGITAIYSLIRNENSYIANMS